MPPALTVAEVVPAGAELEVAWDAVPDATRYQVELDGAALPEVEVTRLRTPPLAEGWHPSRRKLDRYQGE